MSDTTTTNRDLYQRITALVSAEPTRTLEDFLGALWRHASSHRALTELSLTLFVGLIEAAFHEPSNSGDLPSAAPLGAYDHSLVAYALFEQTIRFQIRDLQEMAIAGTLTIEHRYFGIDSPRGSRWYNFEPATYLECGLAGTFGGYAEGDRALVPGPVAVLDATGALIEVDPADIETPEFEPGPLGWDDFADFLRAGQQYE